MNDPGPFRTVLRGYEPGQVDQRVGELVRDLDASRTSSAALAQHVAVLERHLADADAAARAAVANAVAQALTQRGAHGGGDPVRPAGPQLGDDGDGSATPSDRSAPARPKHPGSAYVELGARIGQLLALAEEEALDLVSRAEADAEATGREVQAAARLVRTEADRYDTTVRGDARTEAARVLAEAQRTAEDVVDAAERDAMARREEGEALWEQHRASAAQAAADFELSLAARRERAEAEYTQKLAAARDQLAAVERAAAQARARGEQEVSAAQERAHQLVTDAQDRADQVVARARVRADRVHAESERELAAASHRRDSINAQLTNVRQMLATLSGSAPVIGFEERPPAPPALPAARSGGPLPLSITAPDDRGDRGDRDARDATDDRDDDSSVAQVLDLRSGARLPVDHRR